MDPLRAAHAWVYFGDARHPYTVFDLSVGHSSNFPQAFLSGYKGFLQADGYLSVALYMVPKSRGGPGQGAVIGSRTGVP